ncbi:MAG: hypothetical protein A2Z29_07580 [Chloroflexi bacterium RBG_16_56_11]|nr:MAG: hypothetical protein A2Z29_07580 [Chloroflexi bacterium RBG_16_56_11]
MTRLTDPLLTTSEVARVLHIHVNTVRAWSDLGILKSFRLGPRQDRRFKLKDVEEFIMNYPITDTPES